MADKELKQAEAMKAIQNDVKGNECFRGEIVHSVFVDENYSMMGGHVDIATRNKIINGEYVDFSCLLPKDRLNDMDETRMELVNRNGHSYWVPAEKEGNIISSFYHWEQAFRIFSRIYTERFPNRVTELIQYNHVINSASMSFTWENVYAYDKDFRMHLSRYPDRSWGVILQQAYMLRLKDRLSGRNDRAGNASQNSAGRGHGKICYKFTRGHCTYGLNCKFEHRCAICNKWGHGAHNCKRASGSEKQRCVDKNKETGESTYCYHKEDRDHDGQKRKSNGGGSK